MFEGIQWLTCVKANMPRRKLPGFNRIRAMLSGETQFLLDSKCKFFDQWRGFHPLSWK